MSGNRPVFGAWTAGSASEQEGRAAAGEYEPLYKYLRDRYADRVVLTFNEIEDLLGFSLPKAARIQEAWWAATDATARHSAQSDSWMRASRSATVNLPAQRVVFERHNSLRPQSAR